MDAVVVYESMWGNTEAIARAIAEGFGAGAVALTTDEATPQIIERADLVVAGAPVHAMNLPTHQTRASASEKPLGDPGLPADVSHPALRDWLENIPRGPRCAAAFETHIRGPLGRGAARAIAARFAAARYELLDEPQGFTVRLKTSSSEPASLLMPGEEDRARQWGKRLAVRLGAYTGAS